MSISANTYYTASTIAEIKGLTTRPSVIQSLEGNGVYNWTAGSTLDGDDVTVIEPTSPTPAGRYILEVTDYPLTVEDLAALKALTARPESVVVKTGPAAGVWQWVAGSSTTADDALVVECTSGAAGRYKRIYNRMVVAEWFTTAAEAVAFAYANTADLYFGTVISAASTIPNFHDVRKFGPGGINTGTDTFYVNPTDAQTNTLYVASTGLDTNDGLDSTRPFLTGQAAADDMQKYGPVLQGTWELNFAAGTYLDRLSIEVQSSNLIRIVGPVWIGVGSSPSVIFDGNVLDVTGMADNGSGLIRVTVASVGSLVTGNSVTITGTVGTTEANDTWTVTKISATQFDLQASTFSNAWVSDGVCVVPDTSLNMLSVNGPFRVYVENIHIKDCSDNVLQVINGAYADMWNLHLTRGGLSGSSGACLYLASARALIDGQCLIEDSRGGGEGAVSVLSSRLSIGRTGTDATDSPTIKNPGGHCVRSNEQSTIKLRRVYLEDAVSGVVVNTQSHASHESGGVTDVTLAYNSKDQNSSVSLPPAGAVTYSGITALRYCSGTSGIKDRPFNDVSADFKRVALYAAADLTNSTITGTTAVTDIMSIATSLLDNDFNYKGRAIKAVITGTITGTNNTKAFRMAGSVGGLITSLSAAAGDAGLYRAELMVTCMSTAAATVDITTDNSILIDGELVQQNNSASTDNLSAAQDIEIALQLANASDSVTVTKLEIWQAGIY